jgi:DNA-binding response OmpR family regulator
MLIIDDEEMLGEIVKDYFEDLGITVKQVVSGKEGIDELLENDYDVALVDLRLPDTSGTDLISRVSRERSHIKYFIFTGSLDFILNDEMRSLGLSDESVIYKPVRDMSELYKRIMNSFR